MRRVAASPGGRSTSRGRHGPWLLRCALAAVAVGCAAKHAARNGPHWEPDVAHLHWSTDVPAVTVCPLADTGPTEPHRWRRPEKTSKYSEVDNTLSANILKHTKYFKEKDTTVLCQKSFNNCSWNGKAFNCCRHFQPQQFIIKKPCFTMNSMQTINKRKRLVVSHFSKKGTLKLEFNEPVKISLHDPSDVQFEDVQQPHVTINTDERGELLYTTRQIIEDASLAILDFSKRGCLLRGERKLFHHFVYSRSACTLECALREPQMYAKNSTLCDCPPTCSGMDVHSVWNGTQESYDNVTIGIITMLKPATERLIMKARKSYVDYIVIFACLSQLFTGFNLLEIPKFILNNKKCKSVLSKN